MMIHLLDANLMFVYPQTCQPTPSALTVRRGLMATSETYVWTVWTPAAFRAHATTAVTAAAALKPMSAPPPENDWRTAIKVLPLPPPPPALPNGTGPMPQGSHTQQLSLGGLLRDAGLDVRSASDTIRSGGGGDN